MRDVLTTLLKYDRGHADLALVLSRLRHWSGLSTRRLLHCRRSPAYRELSRSPRNSTLSLRTFSAVYVC